MKLRRLKKIVDEAVELAKGTKRPMMEIIDEDGNEFKVVSMTQGRVLPWLYITIKPKALKE